MSILSFYLGGLVAVLLSTLISYLYGFIPMPIPQMIMRAIVWPAAMLITFTEWATRPQFSNIEEYPHDDNRTDGNESDDDSNDGPKSGV